jgi:LysM repeat protein
MKDDPKLQMNDDFPDDSTYSPKRRPMRSGNSRFLQILLGSLLILIFMGGILYFLGKRTTSGEANLLQLRVAALEQKMAGLEKQLVELQGKISPPGSDPALLQRVDALTQKVEAMERQKQPAAGSRAKPSLPSKPAVSTEKRYHTVQKGETLYWISKKYGVTVVELQKLNNLSADQSIRTGQKLLVSTGR